MDSAASADRPLSLFYSYSHRDEAFRRELGSHLSILQRTNLIAEWHDRMIGAGDDWQLTIDRELAAADIMLLLVSSDFIASDYCWGEEMTKALQRHTRGEAQVIPIILRPCRWQSTPLAQLQAVPRDGKPVTEWLSRDAAFDDIAASIERIIAELQNQRSRAAVQAQQQEEEARQAAELEAARARSTPDKGASAGRKRLFASLGLVLAAVAGVFGWQHWQAPSSPDGGPRVVEKSAIAAPVATTPSPKAVELKSLETFSDCKDCPEMVVIPGGTFLMGSPKGEEGRDSDEGPQHAVTLKPFALGKDEVTFDEWDACVADGGCNGYRPDDHGWGRGKRPVVNGSWNDVQAYVAWLSKATGKPYRLPTEAEWEYATRAGTTAPFALPAPNGSDDIAGKGLANCRDCGSEWDNKSAAPVGSFPANAWGLFDMHGNVWEWVEDVYHDSYQGAPADGSAWTEGEGKVPSRDRVSRGGSWYYDSSDLRSAARNRLNPVDRDDDLGFRVARSLDTLAPQTGAK